ncbi:MAG: hypothetical protein GC199_04830 [Alphaproteobacteria bacterium]|nr:hypothetical protein [Alphaproteobacteria bacterium]
MIVLARVWQGALAVMLLALLAASPAAAHTRSQSYATWTLKGENVSVVFSAPLRELTRLPADETDGALRLEGLLAQHLIAALQVETDGHPCPMQGPPRLLRGRKDFATVEARFLCPSAPAAAYRLSNDAFFDLVTSHVNLARIFRADGSSEERIFTRATRTQRVPVSAGAEEPATATVLDFAGLGIAHILEGIDHLAFLAALMLSTSSIGRLALALTGFTLGHTVAVTASVTGVTVVSAAPVEVLIAFTILLVPLGNVVRRVASAPDFIAIVLLALAAMALVALAVGTVVPTLTFLGMALIAAAFLGLQRRGESLAVMLALTAGFGVIHGSSFAEALVPLQLDRESLAAALIGFNVGVEIGQIMVAAPVGLLAALWARRLSPPGRALAGRAIEATVFGIGFYWFTARVFGVG